MPGSRERASAVAHLLRRAGFGPSAFPGPDHWSTWAGMRYEDALERVLAQLDVPRATDPEGFDAYVPGAPQQVWLERMLGGEGALAEKLTLFWHGHFATSDAKVQDPQLLWNQYTLLREQGSGPLRRLLEGINRDVAMIRWLDGNANRKGHANENYARELQELFTLGIGNYTESDVREIARAFTGWGSRSHAFLRQAQFHDDGEKTIHGRTGRWDGDDVVAILLEQPACAPFLAAKLLRFFSHPDPSPDEIEALAGVLRATDFDVKAALAALLGSPGFLAQARRRVLVRSPVEFLVGSLRALALSPVQPWMHGALDRMGQILFRPPSVKGWTAGRGWLGSGAIVERLRTAQRLAEGASEGSADLLLEIAFQGDVPEPLAAALEGRSGAGRVATVLGGPEFQLC